MKLSMRWIAALALAGALAVPATPAAAAEDVFTPAQEEAIDAAIGAYLRAHPEVIVEALNALEAREQAAAEERVATTLATRRAELVSDPDSFVAGNPVGDVTIVEFFDYRCPYCKRIHPVIVELLDGDRGIRFVYKEWPILGPDSVFAARLAIAAGKRGKYKAVHDALMSARGELTADAALALAASVGLDAEALKQDVAAQTAEVDAIFKRNYDLAAALDITGTPGFVVGETVIHGADPDALAAAIAEAREGAD
jgi:protein-disulfide isomerase